MHNSEDVQRLAVSSTGKVFVATSNTIYQYRNNSISFDDLDSDIDIIEEISIFTLFEYQQYEYLLRCNHTACFVHNTSDIQQVWTTQPFRTGSFGHSLGGDFSAHLVFVPCNGSEYCDLFSAISDKDTGMFSQRSFQYRTDIFHFDHSFEESKIIRSKSGTKFEFIHSFYFNGFVYFLRNTISPNGNRTAFISQMCSTDHYFRSYMESRIECNGYTTLITAQFLHSGSSIFLLASFSGHGSQTKYPGSIWCKFEMDLLEKYFEIEQRACFTGSRGSFPSWINGSGSSCSVSRVMFCCVHMILGK